MLVGLLNHKQPDTRDVVQLLMALRQHTDLRTPMDLRAHLLQMTGNNVSSTLLCGRTAWPVCGRRV